MEMVSFTAVGKSLYAQRNLASAAATSSESRNDPTTVAAR
jgi:hypothetical protein